MVKCDSEKTKWDIIKASRSLKYLNDRHESCPFTVAVDRTQKERQDGKNVIKELSTVTESAKVKLI